jgi:hypothetical protein
MGEVREMKCPYFSPKNKKDGISKSCGACIYNTEKGNCRVYGGLLK